MASATLIFQKKQQAVIDRIRAVLTEKEWTQRELAQKTGMKDSVISRIVHNETNLTLKTIAILEHALGSSLISVP